MNNVKKSLSGNLKTIFFRILVRKMTKLWSQLSYFHLSSALCNGVIFIVCTGVSFLKNASRLRQCVILVIVVINPPFIGTSHTFISQIVIISDDI